MTTDQAIQAKFKFRGRNLNLPWHAGRRTRDDLARLFGELGFKTGVEVGTCRGRFAHMLLTSAPGLHLTCVDPWGTDRWNSSEKQEGRYRLTLERLSGLNVSVLRMTSAAAVSRFNDNSLDFVYIDGNHAFDYAMRDLLDWVPKVKIGGIVALHDYHAQVGADVMTAVNAYTHCHDIRPWYVTSEGWPTAFWVQR